jgi:hypothetical protein
MKLKIIFNLINQDKLKRLQLGEQGQNWKSPLIS